MRVLEKLAYVYHGRMDGVQFFDPKQDFAIAWKSLPHWSQAGTVCFITWAHGRFIATGRCSKARTRTRRIIEQLQPRSPRQLEKPACRAAGP
jgi:hypothetical protein